MDEDDNNYDNLPPQAETIVDNGGGGGGGSTPSTSVSQNDLQRGMYLKNTGSTPINVYNGAEANSTVMMAVQPGEMIGKIVDFKNAANGYMALFTSDAITSSASILQQAANYLFSWNPGEYLAGGVYFNDLVNGVPDLAVQLANQRATIKSVQQHEDSVVNTLKDQVNYASDSLFEAIPWKLVAVAAAGYVFLNWNTFFKSAKTR